MLRSLLFVSAKSVRFTTLFFLFNGFCMLYLTYSAANNISTVPFSPASYITDDFSHLSNPALLDLPGSSAIAYRQTFMHEEGALVHQATFNLFGFGFFASHYTHNAAEQSSPVFPWQGTLYSLSKGIWLHNSLGFGIAYSLGSGDSFEGYKSWSIGFLLRPWHMLSLGFASHHLGSPTIEGSSLPRMDVYSIAIRPFKNFLILSADAHIQEGKGWKNAQYTYAMHITPFRDISVFFSYDDQKQITFGLTLPIDAQTKDDKTQFTVNYKYTRFNSANLHSIGISLSEPRYQNPLGTPSEILNIKISGNIPEIPIQQRMEKSQPAFCDILSAIHRATTSPTIKAIALTIDTNTLGFARIQELREELARFKNNGGKVYAILLSSGNKNYYLASIANKIYFNPAESFILNGLSAHVYFLGELLDKIGVKFESIKKGQYKFFNEQFTSRAMSEEYRTSLIELLTSLNEIFTSDIARARNISPETINEMFRLAMTTGSEARAYGFIDELAYPSDALADISKKVGRSRIIQLSDYLPHENLNAPWGTLPEIAIIYVEGTIVRGKKEKGGIAEKEVIGDENYRLYLTEAMENPFVHGIVVRINSGGGSAVASDLMLHYLTSAKQKKRKPVVFSFGDIAASGGYYIACSGDKIFASNSTITGSIGVVSGKVSLKKLYEMMGINKETVAVAELADIFTESREMTEREREIFQKTVDAIYNRFTKVVSEGRKIEMAKIPHIAEGRVFTGKQSFDKKLIDEIGNIMRAVEHVRSLAGIKGEYAIRHIPKKKTPLVFELFSMAHMNANLPNALKKTIAQISELEILYEQKEAALYLIPYKIVIE